MSTGLIVGIVVPVVLLVASVVGYFVYAAHKMKCGKKRQQKYEQMSTPQLEKILDALDKGENVVIKKGVATGRSITTDATAAERKMISDILKARQMNPELESKKEVAAKK